MGSLINIPECVDPVIASRVVSASTRAPFRSQSLLQSDSPGEKESGQRAGRVFTAAQLDCLMFHFQVNPRISDGSAAFLAKELSISCQQVSQFRNLVLEIRITLIIAVD